MVLNAVKRTRSAALPFIASISIILMIMPPAGWGEQIDTGAWFLRTKVATALFSSVTRGGELFVAVGEGFIDNGNGTWSHSGHGAMRVSGDGGVWIDLPSAASLPILRAATFGTVEKGKSRYVVLGDDKALLTSPDGLTWTQGTLPVDIMPRALSYRCTATEPVIGSCLSGQFVAVGWGGILTSSDALTWTQPLPATPDQPSDLFKLLNAVTFDGSNFVAVGRTWSNTARILVSADGTSWSDVSPNPGLPGELYAVTYGNGVWLAVGGHSSGGWYAADILRSTDRTTWTPVTQSYMDKFMAAIYTGNEFVMAPGPASSSSLYTSPDGLTWTTVAIPSGTISSFSGRSFALGADTVVGVGLGVNSCGLIQSSNALRTRRGGTRDNPFALFDSDGQPPSRVGLPVSRVNTSALNVVLEGSLFFMKTRGTPVDLRLTFNAYPDSPPGMFGRGWWFNYELGLTHTETTARLVTGGGKPLLFTSPNLLGTATPENPILLKPPVGVYDRLTYNGDTWLFWEKKSRRTYRFIRGAAGGIAYLTAIADRNGNTVDLTVDPASGHVTAITDPAGRTVTFGYAGGFCTRITVPDGRAITLAYDGSGNLTGMTDMNGHSAAYLYDGTGFLTQTTVEGRTTRFSYIARPRTDNNDKCLSTVTDPVNGATTYEFLPNSTSRVKRTSAKGVVTTLNAQDGNTAVITDPLNNVRSISYVDGLPASFTNANNRKSTFLYDDRGNMTRATQPAPLSSTNYTYDANDLMIRRTDALVNNWDYAYDAKGNPTGVTTPIGYTILMAYDDQGRLLSVTDAAGHATTFVNDGYGNITRVTNALEHATDFTFDAYGLRCTLITDALGRVKTMAFDGNDRLTSMTYLLPDGATRSVSNTYDAFGQTMAVDERGNATRFERNMLGFITRVTDPLKGVSLYEYDANNNLLRTTDPLLRLSAFTYDNADRLTGNTDPLGAPLTRGYDAEGNLTSLTNRRGKATTMTYESANLLKTIRYPASPSSISYTRDALGRVTRITNGRGNQVNFTYDKDGRMTEKRYGAVSQATFTYDGVGNLTSLVDATGTTGYTYNERNEVTGITYPGGKSVSFAYDPVGNLARLVYPDGTAVSYTHDLLNRVRLPLSLRNAANSDIRGISEKRNQVTSATWTDGSVTLTYDAVANLIREVRGNGASTDYTYDAAGRITAIVHGRGQTPFVRLAFVYDAAGNCIQEKASGLPAAPRPASVATATYTDGDQVTTWGERRYTYDGDGNLTGIDGNELSATYDEENRLTGLTRGTATVAYTYGGSGERASSVAGTKTVKYHYDRRGRLLFETDAEGVVTANYIYVGARLVARGTAAGGYRYYHGDRNGSTIAMTDAGGNVIALYGYTPYGAKAVQGDDGGNPATYVGGYGVLDEGGGLYFMKNRLYDATTGRFLQRDPVGYDGGLNLYAYVGGNPVSRIDPRGTGWLDWGQDAGKFLDNANDALVKKNQREANIAKKGILRAAEEGDLDADREARGRDAVKLGKEGAKLVLDAQIELVTGMAPKVTELAGTAKKVYGASMSFIKKLGKAGEEGGAQEDGEAASSQAAPIPDNSDTSAQQAPIDHVEEIDWDKVRDPSVP